MKNIKVSWTDLLLQQLVLVTGEPTQERAASSTQVVNSGYVCLVHKQMCHTQKLNFCKNEVDKYILCNVHIFIQGFLFYASELKSLDKFLIPCDVVAYLSEHFHQKIRQHAIVIAETTLHLLIHRTFSQFTKPFCIIAVVLQRLLISKATFMLRIRQQKWHFLSIMSTHFSADSLGGLNFAHA